MLLSVGVCLSSSIMLLHTSYVFRVHHCIVIMIISIIQSFAQGNWFALTLVTARLWYGPKDWRLAIFSIDSFNLSVHAHALVHPSLFKSHSHLDCCYIFKNVGAEVPIERWCLVMMGRCVVVYQQWLSLWIWWKVQWNGGCHINWRSRSCAVPWLWYIGATLIDSV